MEDKDRAHLGGDDSAPEQQQISSGEAGAQPDKQSDKSARIPKRRTKTGCLTCRKRRIKCGEEKPRCNNCIKAKRDCEGYTHRVVFKNALGPFGASYDPAVPANLQAPVTLFPRPPPQQQQQEQQEQQQQQQQHFNQPGQSVSGRALNPQQRLLAPRLPAAPTAVPPAVHSQHPSSYPSIPPRSQTWQSVPPTSQPPVPRPVQRHASEDQVFQTAGQSAYPATSYSNSNRFLADYDPAAPSAGMAGIGVVNRNHLLTYQNPENNTGSRTLQRQPDQDLAETLGLYIDNTFQQAQAYYSWGAGDQAFPALYSPTDLEDDYYDVGSDDELQDVTEEEGFNQLNLIAASAQQDAIRSYNTFLNEPNILASYQPSMGSSPLNNPKTARIWVHFIHATGPTLSIWERHSTNTTTLLSGPVPPAQQGLWTYVMPLKALEHPALLQAILAMGSLHISGLQRNNYTVTFKHYQYALRKISKAVGLPGRRRQPATLAATLLLAYYEVTAGEHSKWDRHVAGAAQLLKEVDFVGLTRDLRAYRRSIERQKQHGWGPYDAFTPQSYTEDDPFADLEMEVDANIVSILTGKAVDFDRIGHVDVYPRFKRKHFTRKDIDNFRIQCDFYWWYCKQDLFLALIGGHRLHTPYERWDQCPPRAKLGRVDALYGSFDHLVLLMARMMDFGYRDRKRKLKSLEASGGEWRPHPGFFNFLDRFGPKPSAGAPQGPPMGPPGSTNPPGPSHSNQRPPTKRNSEENPMYGMVPTGSPSGAPAAFTSMGESPPYAGFTEDYDDATLVEAEAEWESILAAYHFFESQLGEAFAPLPADAVTTINSPFGPALQYRSSTIAVLWGYYYTGRIMLNRLHPSMPPATMVAATTAASTTEHFAQTIGKLAAGIYYPQMDFLEIGGVNPNLGGAWSSVTVNLYVAAVQYNDATQRAWTVATLRTFGLLTGWETADTIANGCESAWTRRAEAGRGPPYNPKPFVHKKVERYGEFADGQFIQDPSGEGRFVQTRKRRDWAMGLLALESDLAELDIDDHA